MATELGKFLRKLRVDNDELMKQMADRLGLASSTLSSIEAGRRKPGKGFLERVIGTYELSQKQAAELRDAYDRSRDEVELQIKGLPNQDQRLAIAFARKFATLSDEQKKSIRGILEED